VFLPAVSAGFFLVVDASLEVNWDGRLGPLVKVKVKERIVLREIHLRTTGRHLSMGSHSVICHPTEVPAPPSPQPDRLVLDLSTP